MSSDADCIETPYYSPSEWHGSASLARPSQSAACLPPSASVQPGRWSLWQPEALQWLSGSLVLSSGPQAEPRK